MKAYVIVYDGFNEFEIILANYFIKTKGEIISVSLNKNSDIVTSFEGFQIKPHTTIAQINLADIDLLIIPGGDPDELLECRELKEILIELNKRGTFLAAICSGTLHLANSKILDNKKYTSSMALH